MCTGWEYNMVLECSCWLFDKGCLFLHLFKAFFLHRFILKLLKINVRTKIQHMQESIDTLTNVSDPTYTFAS